MLFLSTLVGVPVLPQLSEELGADATEIPIVVSAALATVVVAQFLTSQALIVMAGIGLVFSDGFVALLVFYGLFCTGETITYLLCFVYATDIFDRKYIGTAMGAFDSVMDLSLLAGPMIAISVYKSTGQIAPIFLIAVVPAIFAFFTTATWLPKEAKEPANDGA